MEKSEPGGECFGGMKKQNPERILRSGLASLPVKIIIKTHPSEVKIT